MNNNGILKLLKVSDQELPVSKVPDTKINLKERNYLGTKQSAINKKVDSENADASNTDPNYAYIVENGNVYQENIESEKEFRWYCFNITEKSKVTIALQMADTLNADLFMFQYDTKTNSLNFVDGRASEGLGVAENYACVLNAGIYFFAVYGKEGTGKFGFAYYNSSKDVDYEVNDSLSTATGASIDAKIEGVLDSPWDKDYYKLVVTKEYIINYSISTTDDYSLEYMGSTGNNSAIYKIENEENQVLITPGTYYFVVYSKSGSYSSTSEYSVNFSKLYELSSDSTANIIGVCKEAGIAFQTNKSGTVYYVNGNPIDINYSYKVNRTNSAGSQSYNISLIDRDDVYVSLKDNPLEPAAIYYMKSTRPAMNVGSEAALELTFKSNNNFYSIHCMCTGAYKQNNLWKDYNQVTVIIDPSTGKLIDIENFNYFYDYAVGSNSLTFTRRYPNMTFFQLGAE